MITGKPVRYLFLLCLFLRPLTVWSQATEFDYALEIRDLKIPTTENAQFFIDSLRQNNPENTPVDVIVQFYQIPDEAQRTSVINSGIKLKDYIPNRAYSALIVFPLQAFDCSLSGIRSIIPIQPQWKILDPLTGKLDSSSSSQVKVQVSFVGEADINKVEEAVREAGGSITDRKFALLNTFEVSIPANQVKQLARSPYVKSIQSAGRDQNLNDDERGATGSAGYNSDLAAAGTRLTGLGVTIGIGDNSTGQFHVDTRDRVLNFNPAPPQEHGVHVTGTVTGKGILNPRYRGMAPDADILGHFFNLVWAQTGAMYQNYNMTLTNNSYAAFQMDSAYAGKYDQYSRMLDQLSRDYDEVLHVFANGNDGNAHYPPYPQGYRTVVGAYQAAKNVLNVSTKFKNFGHHPGGSKGPTRDGRIKPEVVAFGKDVYSTKLFDDYRIESGTSMAAPAVTGAAALLAERYKKIYAKNATAALLKTLIMNGAQDLDHPGPDFVNGFGFVDIRRSLQMLNNEQFIEASISHQASLSYQLQVPPGTRQLKVMLYWPDAPADPIASKTLVNNLDIEVLDPSAALRLPLVPNPDPAQVTNPAAESVDDRNNVEQVVIDHPTAGNYEIRVKGTQVPAGFQYYVISWDFVPDSIRINYPVAGVPLPANDTARIYWFVPGSTNSFHLQYTLDGTNWITIDNNVPAESRTYRWDLPNISSHEAQLRILENNSNRSATTGAFVINPQPQLQLASIQCPGYINFEWNAVPGATAYIVFKKEGPELVPKDTVTTTNHVFSGLDPDSVYYVAVRPLIQGEPGYISNALIRQPLDGNCSSAFSDGDLVLEEMVVPSSGRKFTSSELTSNESVRLTIRNRGTIDITSFNLETHLNNTNWFSQLINRNVLPGDTIQVELSGLDLSDTIHYLVEAYIEPVGSTDPAPQNNTATALIRHISNPPVDLHGVFHESFDWTHLGELTTDFIGVDSAGYWDFFNSSDSGRLRTYVSSDIVIDSNSASLDLLYSLPLNQNYLTGTFNLNAYDTANTETRLEFQYKLHGRPKAEEGNDVWVRGSDQDSWVRIYQVDTAAPKGQVMHTGSLPVTTTLLQAGQNFSSSFQVRLGQNDTSAIAAPDYGNGLTIDNFCLYSVKNDVQLVEVLAPGRFLCGSSNNLLPAVLVYNSDNLPQHNVQVFYRYNNGSIQTGTIDTLLPKDTVVFSFQQSVNLSASGYHQLDFWLSAAGDSYLLNDSIMNYQVRVQPLVADFPYLENFESGDGVWYTGGTNSSWEWGSPSGSQINRSASGTKAWVTNLSGTYNDQERSWLYSPCIDIAALESPMLSFSLAMDIENCGDELCDLARLEYSFDGGPWNTLGKKGEGYNWYGDHEVWNRQDASRWRVASIAIPKEGSVLRLRFAFISDPAAAREGIAIDDIHIYDYDYPIYDGHSTEVSVTPAVTGWTDLIADNALTGSINSWGQSSGSVSAILYKRNELLHPVVQQYVLPRSYALKSTSSPADSFTLRWYLPDEEVEALLNDQQCDTCHRPVDVYRMDITVYEDPDPSKENGSLIDNVNGVYTRVPSSEINWVPYDKGYYAELHSAGTSEYWFNLKTPLGRLSPLVLYPNPIVDDLLFLLWDGAEGEELQFQMKDLLGRVVYSASAKGTGSDTRLVFQLPQLAPAMYIGQFTIGGVLHEVKLVVR